MDVIVDCISVFIVDPICDFLRGKVKVSSWLLNTAIGLMTSFLLLTAVGGTAWFWFEGNHAISVLCGVVAAMLLLFDGWRISRWRKETKKDE